MGWPGRHCRVRGWLGLRLFGAVVTCHACGKEHPDERLVTLPSVIPIDTNSHQPKGNSHHPNNRSHALPNGKQVSNYSREWMVECEAAWVVKHLPNKATAKKMSKADYLRAIADRRGPQAYLELRQAMERQYRLRYPSKNPK